MNISNIVDIIQEIDLTKPQYHKFNLILRNVNLPFGITKQHGRYSAFVSLRDNKLLNDELYLNLTQFDNKIESLNPEPEKLKYNPILKGKNSDHLSARITPQSNLFNLFHVSIYDTRNINVHLCLMFSYFQISDLFGYSISVIQMKIRSVRSDFISPFENLLDPENLLIIDPSISPKTKHHNFICNICYFEKDCSVVCVNGHDIVCLDCFSECENKICPICRGKIVFNIF
jgi:hypothetical protein